MADFTIGPPPELRAVAVEFLDRLELLSYRTYLDTISNFALVGVAGRFIAAGRFAATSFKLQSGLSKAAFAVVPFTLAVKAPGVLHVVLDTAFYKAHDVFIVLDDAYRRYVDWLRSVTREELINSLGPEAYDVLTQGGSLTHVRAELTMPAAWLLDP